MLHHFLWSTVLEELSVPVFQFQVSASRVNKDGSGGILAVLAEQTGIPSGHRVYGFFLPEETMDDMVLGCAGLLDPGQSDLLQEQRVPAGCLRVVNDRQYVGILGQCTGASGVEGPDVLRLDGHIFPRVDCNREKRHWEML